MMKIVFVALLITYFLMVCVAFAEPIPDDLAVRAVIGEASGEGYQGMLAVSCAIRNRGTLRGVYGVNAKHVDRQPAYVWALARKAWKESAKKDITNGADHWESKKFKVPYWAKDMEVVYEYKNHVFYRAKTKTKKMQSR